MSEKAALGKATDSSADDGKDSSVECPTCGQSCKSLKGMRQHHTRSHGESVAKVTLSCDGCGSEFKRWKSQLDGSDKKYCSPDCYHENFEQKTGEQSPQSNMITVECGHCGKQHKRRPSRVQRANTVYCSRECADKDHSERMVGEGNPRWIDGQYVSDYGPNWSEKRQEALDRDNHLCQYCAAGVNDAILSVHHIRKMRYYHQEYDKPECYSRANKLSNLVTLCLSCHGQWEGIPLKPQLR